VMCVIKLPEGTKSDNRLVQGRSVSVEAACILHSLSYVCVAWLQPLKLCGHSDQKVLEYRTHGPHITTSIESSIEVANVD
jgi:hypothetical protein